MMNIDPKILAKIDELERLGKIRDDAWQIPRVEGELLLQIALTSSARRIVEIGTSYGFSGLFWGAALRQTGGELHTVDKDPRKYDSSKLTFAQAGLNDLITNHLGDGQQVAKILPEPIDLAFIDADKPACRAYFDLLWPKIRIGGSILTDNATTHKEQLRDYIQYLRGRADASSIEVAVGNGVEWTTKIV
jgi:predicted O-methyltransferase YrrM